MPVYFPTVMGAPPKSLAFAAMLLGFCAALRAQNYNIPPTPVFPQPNTGTSMPPYGVPPVKMGATAEDILENMKRENEARMGVVRPISAEEALQRQLAEARQQGEHQALYAEMRADLRRSASAPDPYVLERACMERNGLISAQGFANPEQARYRSAFRHLEELLTGRKPGSLADAVFLTEQPVLGIAADRSRFDAGLADLEALVLQQTGRSGSKDATALHDGIQRLFTDTLVDRRTGRVHYPMRYDLEDFFGEQDPRKILVTKLMEKGDGQCRSMPLLYLLLAERLGIPAYWAFGPNHSYVKYPGPNGAFENFETTVGMKSSDQWLMRSGFIRSLAVQNWIYLDTVGTRRTIAHLMADLLQLFEQRFGTDPALTEHTLNTVLSYAPKDIHAISQLNNLYIQQLRALHCSLGYPPRETFGAFPELASALQKVEHMQKLMDDLGFAEMPPDAYAGWLASLDRERLRRAAEPPRSLNGTNGLGR